jgi:hypothetical protein
MAGPRSALSEVTRAASPYTTSAPLRPPRAASGSWPRAAGSVRRSSSITGPACNHRRGRHTAAFRATGLPADDARAY